MNKKSKNHQESFQVKMDFSVKEQASEKMHSRSLNTEAGKIIPINSKAHIYRSILNRKME